MRVDSLISYTRCTTLLKHVIVQCSYLFACFPRVVDGRTVMIWSERDYKRWLRKKLKLTPAESKVALDEQRKGFLATKTDA